MLLARTEAAMSQPEDIPSKTREGLVFLHAQVILTHISNPLFEGHKC